jgi:hypothetical protein
MVIISFFSFSLISFVISFLSQTFSFFSNFKKSCSLFLIGGPREDSTRVGSAGTARRQSVDVSPLRRVNQAIYLLTTGVCVCYLAIVQHFF